MPHKGRPYPYHPIYWATEAWFYRGFVPWKLRAFDETTSPPFLGCTVGSPPLISLAGEPDSTARHITYRFDPLNDCLITRIDVTLSRASGLEGGKAHWEGKFYFWDSTIQTSHLYQPFPQRVVNGLLPAMTCATPDPDQEFTFQLRFVPATYEEGGSPWD